MSIVVLTDYLMFPSFNNISKLYKTFYLINLLVCIIPILLQDVV